VTVRAPFRRVRETRRKLNAKVLTRPTRMLAMPPRDGDFLMESGPAATVIYPAKARQAAAGASLVRQPALEAPEVAGAASARSAGFSGAFALAKDGSLYVQCFEAGDHVATPRAGSLSPDSRCPGRQAATAELGQERTPCATVGPRKLNPRVLGMSDVMAGLCERPHI
jgi:hypothetical protein